MCGILWCDLLPAGGAPVPLGAAKAAFARLAHRGPDHSGYQVLAPGGQGGHFVGCHRLAVTNPTPAGDQPLSSPQGDGGRLTLVCNGQIYGLEGSQGLRSDVDHILRLFGGLASPSEQAAADRVPLSSPEEVATLLRGLDGDFAFALVEERPDPADVTVLLARDPVGVRPLFYGEDATGAVVAAASEAKALLELPGVAVARVFPPGHFWDSVGREFVRFTDVYPDPQQEGKEGKEGAESPSYEEAAAEVRRLLLEAVRKRVVASDRPVAFLCSGGLDSSVVLAAALASGCVSADGSAAGGSAAGGSAAPAAHVFSMQYDSPEPGGGTAPDAFYAGRLAAELGVRHTAVRFDGAALSRAAEVVRRIESHDPNTVRASLPMYLLAEHIATATPYRVVLSGEGADELFMGYSSFRGATAGEAAEESVRLVRNLHAFDGLRADRCMAAHGLDLRVPFLDIAFVRYVLALPGRLRCQQQGQKGQQQGAEKALLRDAFRPPEVPPTERPSYRPPPTVSPAGPSLWTVCRALVRAGVLDRTKERFSDGAGLSYVPELLRRLAPDATDLAGRLAAEAAAYRAAFEAEFPGWGHLVPAREARPWTAKAEGTGQTRVLAEAVEAAGVGGGPERKTPSLEELMASRLLEERSFGEPARKADRK